MKIIFLIDTENASNTYLREVRNMAELSTHLVIRYNNSWFENNCLYIQMEYCFHNLMSALTIKPKVFERTANQAMNSIEYFISCEIFRQITEALNYLHSIQVIHRDLKPENILIGFHNNKRICKLADFGLSKFIEGHTNSNRKLEATFRYAAPEIFRGQNWMTQQYGPKVDVYSLGVIGLEVFDLEDEKKSIILIIIYF